jgi:hypothetical protein
MGERLSQKEANPGESGADSCGAYVDIWIQPYLKTFIPHGIFRDIS